MSALSCIRALGKLSAAGLALSLASCTATNFSEPVSASTSFDGPFSIEADRIMFAPAEYDSVQRDQILLVNVSGLLETKAVSPKDRAEVFYELGIIYDRLGLEATARSMFMNSLAENRRFAAPYNFVGIYFAKDGRFQEALDAFDSSLELDPDDVYVNFNRGIVLYLAGRSATALPDFRAFYRSDPDDPYRLLWLYLCERDLSGNEEALKILRQRRDRVPMQKRRDNWGYNVVSYYLGERTEDEFFRELRSHEKEKEVFGDHLCEGYFYAGMQAWLAGDDKRCFDYMTLSAATRRYAFLEYRNALVIMRDLNVKHGRDPGLIRNGGL